MTSLPAFRGSTVIWLYTYIRVCAYLRLRMCEFMRVYVCLCMCATE